MKRLSAIRLISAICVLLVFTMFALDIVNSKQGIGADHGYFIITLILITSALELVRSELAALHKKLSEKS